MNNIEKKVAAKAIRKGVRAGRKGTFAEAKRNAGNLKGAGTGMSGKIKKSLVLRAMTKKQLHLKNAFGMEIRFKDSEDRGLVHISKEGVRSFIPHAIEYGHVGPYMSEKSQKKRTGGDYTKQEKVAAPKPFMIPAHESTRSHSMYIAKKVITQEITKEWNK